MYSMSTWHLDDRPLGLAAILLVCMPIIHRQARGTDAWCAGVR
jgi:hypothetical protein